MLGDIARLDDQQRRLAVRVEDRVDREVRHDDCVASAVERRAQTQRPSRPDLPQSVKSTLAATVAISAKASKTYPSGITSSIPRYFAAYCFSVSVP